MRHVIFIKLNGESIMARIGINYQDVAAAAATVQGHNQIPTVDRIREVLRTGSKSTIARYLKEWKLKTEQITHCQGMPEELGALVKGLWERLQHEAEQKITQHQLEADKEIQDAKASYANEQKEHIALQNHKKLLEDQLHQQANNLSELQTCLQTEKQMNAKLTEGNHILSQQVNDQKTENQRLHQLLTHVQANLEHYQNSMQKLREEQTLIAENQRVSHEREMNSLKQQLSASTSECLAIYRQHDQLSAELKLLSQQCNTYSEEKTNLSKELQDKTIKENTLQNRCDQLHETCSDYKKLITNHLATISENEKKIAVLTEQVSHLNKSLIQSQDSIRLLRDEKLFLAQEKALLQGQFKQLQTLE